MSDKIKDGPGVMYKISEFIVDKRNIFFLFFIFAAIFSFFSQNWVEVEQDVTKYLPEETETRRGIELMDKEFLTYGTASVMVSNISYDRAKELAEELEKIDGVSGVEFENNDKHFKNASALFSVTFNGKTEDEVSEKALSAIKRKIKAYDTYILSDVGNDSQGELNSEMSVILVIAAIIIGAVLLFTSKSYTEVIVLAITFAAAAVLNKGTNFMLGKISFISNSVAVVLQLALAIDYAIILCHRFTEEREHLDRREAVIAALSKAIPEISASSLTTISGLAALITMQFKIGQDLGIVLIKAIFLSLFSVFTLMPGFLMLLGNSMERTRHKNLVPSISFIGRFDIRTKKIIPPIFLILMALGFFLSNKCPYSFGNTGLSTIKKSTRQIAEQKIENTFRRTNLLALVVPSGDYEKEARLLSEIGSYSEVEKTQGLANTEAMSGYMLTDALTPREFGELAEVDYEATKLLYAAYAVHLEDYGKVINNLDSYSVPLIDMLMFLHDEISGGYVTLDDDITDKINEIYEKIYDAKLQLESEKYSRLLVYLNTPEEGGQAFALLDTLHGVLEKYYPEDALIVGNTTSDYDLQSSFSRDNVVIGVLSALFVVLVLFFTFKSAALPIFLIAVIQGSVWINFSFPYLMNKNLYFLGYLIVSSIQMGANIDYAIVISSRYTELKQKMGSSEAMIETLNLAFPTILTSGTILAAAAALIAFISTNGIIAAIGECLARGTVISIILVLGVLPQILLLGDKITDATAFSLTPKLPIHKGSGLTVVNGRVRGRINGVVDANIRGVIKGDVSAVIRSADITEEEDGENEKE